MVIKSPFKDYYDFVGNQYGGGDPKIVYRRARLVPLERYFGYTIGGEILVRMKEFGLVDPLHWEPENTTKKYLVLCGKSYLMDCPAIPSSSIPFRVKIPGTEKSRYYRPRTDTFKFGKEYPWLIDLCRKVGAPVFTINRVGTWFPASLPYQICIDGDIPVLGKIGISALYSPQQMYQEIAMFIGNQMTVPPDTEPPVQLSNRQKILKAGFDLVQSFRHRK